MKYQELISRIKEAVGSADDASQNALELVVENVAANLTETTRREFAAALPEELQSAAMMVPTANHIDEDIIEQLMDIEDVEESQARQHLRAAWQAVKDMFGTREVDDITAELPHHMVAVLE
jgi:uncharacterized protein (DUF2267 family)